MSKQKHVWAFHVPLVPPPSPSSPPPPPPAECFTPTGLSSVLVNKLSILCAYRRDQYSLRQWVNRVEKLLKPTRGLSRKAKPRRGWKTDPDACLLAAPFRSSSSHQSQFAAQIRTNVILILVPPFVWVRPLFPLHLKEIRQKTGVHFYVWHDFRPIWLHLRLCLWFPSNH